jgi:hypothetical protein
MLARLLTLISASLFALTFFAGAPANAQGTHSDRALNYLLGQWYSLKSGRLIEFYITRDIPKFSDSYGPEGNLVGSYRAGEGGADYVLEYPTGLKCYYDVRMGSGSDTKEVVFALRRASPERDAVRCVEGVLHRQSDRR